MADAENRFEDVKNGPKDPYNRECTDILCCLLIMINFGVLVGFAIYGYTNGDTTNVYRATDQKGNVCGGSGSFAQAYPYSYFYNPTTGDLSRRTCVKSCPNYNSGSLSTLDCYSAGNNQNKCSYDITVQKNGSYSSTPSNTNQIIGYDTSSIIGRVCVPSATVFDNAFSSYSKTFSDKLRQAGVANFVTDVQNNWRWLLLALVLSVVISVVFMFFLRCFAGCFIWTCIFLTFFLLIALAIVFLYNGGAISRDSFVGNMGISIPSLPSFQYYNIFGYITFGIAAIVLLIIICCCGRIKLAVALCGVAGQFIAETCQIILVPLIMGFFVFALWVFALFAMVCLIGTAKFVVNGSDIFTSIQSYTSSSLGYFYYFVFGTLWTNALLTAITIFVIAAACAVWYFSKAPGVSLDSPVCSGFYMTFRYHFGSLAFGAFILALVQFVQFLFQVLTKQIQASGGGQNPCYQCLVKCIRCCLDCLKRIVEFLNKNAYIQIAITGKNFCSASADAVSLMAANPLRYSIVNAVGMILSLVGKLLIAGLTTFLFYIFITFVTDVKQNIQEPIYLLILIGIASYAIALIFMSIFQISVDTLLACFLIDERSNAKAVYAPQGLGDLMDK